MAPFISENNLAGAALLKLVSGGNASIAEIMRLADFVPPEFRLATREDQQKYGDIILDGAYRNASDMYDKRIQSNPELLERDEDFQANHMEILRRFYKLFESIYNYNTTFTRFLSDLDDGVFIQQSLEGVMGSPEGRQLLIEALFLYGVMLLILDTRIDGVIRERLLVSYRRYETNISALTNMDGVWSLCRSTGFSVAAQKKPANYPEEYFKRLPIPRNFILMAIGRLRSDDIYDNVASYPNPDHRSTALGTQATMLYIALFFAPEILNSDAAKMREIVDKHFPDNWVIAYYLGMVVDLSEVWAGYKAAKAALDNTTTQAHVTGLSRRHVENLSKLAHELQHYLTEGVLTESFVLDHVPKLLNCLRNCNVTLRWLTLHANSRNKKLRDWVTTGSGYNEYHLVVFLLNVSQFEFLLKNTFKKLLAEKKNSWEVAKKEASDRTQELSEYFSGEKALTRVTRNEALQAWFLDISRQVQLLDYSDATMAGRKIHQLMQALEEVQEFHQLESNLQVRSFLQETRNFLQNMIRNVNVKEEILVLIQLVADLSYSWELMHNFVGHFQGLIKRDPVTVIKLRAVFLKLASILDLPLVRILQAESPDTVSVAQYYSGELVEFVRKVLQVIPSTMFSILKEVIAFQTRVSDVPTRLDKDKLLQFAQLDDRYQLARRTHAISVFTEGMLAMETTLYGVIQVDPKQLLEEGVRRELVVQTAAALEKILVFNKSRGVDDVIQALGTLQGVLKGYRVSFEYIQDYLNIYALKIWQEELSRIINYNVERECNRFLKTKISEWDSQYQSRTIPIPIPPPVDDKSATFIGRLGRELLNITDTRKTVFVSGMDAWYDITTKNTVMNQRTFRFMYDSIGAYGVCGLNRLYSFMIVSNLQHFTSRYNSILGDKRNGDMFTATASRLEPIIALPNAAPKLYADAVARAQKLFPLITDCVIYIGQIQLIRRQIEHELKLRCKLDSTNLANALLASNDAVLTDVQLHYHDKDRFPYPKDDNPLLSELATYLDTAGFTDPLQKVFITSAKPLVHLPLALFLYVLGQLSKFNYDSVSGAFLAKNKNDPLDGTPFIVGMITLLRQFHVTNLQTFFGYMGQYIRATIDAQAQKDQRGPQVMPMEVTNALVFMDEFIVLSKLPRRIVDAQIPPFLFQRFRRAAAA